MEIIHPPVGFFKSKDREKSPFIGGETWFEPVLDYPVFPPMWFSSILSGLPPFQAGCCLIPSYSGDINQTLKNVIIFVMDT
jgi:hypothetical protein